MSGRSNNAELVSNRNASRTALGTARLRAIHQLFDARPLILDDPIAPKLFAASELDDLDDAKRASRHGETEALRSHVVLRSRYTEDRLAEAVARRIRQYIILGAGFDTFALRQPEWAHALKIVEVDHRGSQAEKRSRIAAAGLAMADNAKFADVDFEYESLLDGLRRHGVSVTEPTFFSWLGVTMYLAETAIDSTLRSVAAFPAGSEIVFTFLPKPDGQNAFSSLARRVARAGEPFVTSLAPEQVEEKLRDAGFTEIGFLSSEEAAKRYFQHRPADIPVPPRTGIAYAIR